MPRSRQMLLTVPPLIGRRLRHPAARSGLTWFCIGIGIALFGSSYQVPAALGGKLVEINAKQGSHVNKGDVVAYIERPTEA